MNKKVIIATGVVFSFFACFGVANALQSFDDAIYVPSLHVGSQGAGGVTFFNGTILNNTTDSEGTGLPVTFGDDVRIDGAIQRGTNDDDDTWGVKVQDDLMVYGDIEATGALSVDSLTLGPQAEILNVPAAGCHFTSIKATNMGTYISVEESYDYFVTIDCPINLPNGATITNFVANIGDSDGDEYIYVDLYRVDQTTSALTSETIAGVTSETATSGYNQLNDDTVTYPTVDNDTYGYYGSVIFTGGGSLSELYFAGIKVEYTTTGL